MKNFSPSRKWGGIKYKLVDTISQNKKTTFFLIIFALIGFLTGIFTAIRYGNGESLVCFNDFSLSQYLSGELGTRDLFLSRLFSTTICTLIIFITSFSVFLLPVGFILITYRAYLISLNCSLIIIVNGLGGILTCLLIIIPCQILSLLALALFCSFSCKRAVAKKKYGTSCKIWDKLLICYIALLVINGLETLLLYLFSSRIILVL